MTLKQLILSRGAMAVDEVLRIVRACLGGLAAAHAAGVVHRDVKPQNVFLCSNGAVRLLDFGLARLANATALTTKSLILCTPDYAAPEVIAGRAIDARADLYAMGIMMFEMLTGRLPYVAATSFDVLRLHLEGAPVVPSTVRPDVPAHLDAVVGRLAAKAPEDRYATCLLALAAIEQPTLLSAQPAPAPVVRYLCQYCGEPRNGDWPACPACGNVDSIESGGDWLVVLVRAADNRRRRELSQVVMELGGVPGPYLRRGAKPIDGLPRILVKGVSEPVARAVRVRCQAIDCQVELRRKGENNSDLLHKSNTPGYLFAAGLLAPWGALLLLVILLLPEQWVLTALTALAGPIAGAVAIRYADRFLPAMATIARTGSVRGLPPSLAARYQKALEKVRAPELVGTLRKVFERTLTIFGASRASSADVEGTVAEAQKRSLDLALRGFELAEAAQAALERVRQASEAELLATLDALRARQQAEPQRASEYAARIGATERALGEIASLEQTYNVATDRLLRVLAALEQASIDLLIAGAPRLTAVTQQIRRLSIDAAVAKGIAQEMAEIEAGEPDETRE
jgi:hypothetical protein